MQKEHKELVDLLTQIKSGQDVFLEDYAETKRTAKDGLALANKVNTKIETVSWIGGFIAAIFTAVGTIWGTHK